MARNEDVYLQSSGGKWVRYDAVGHMVKGEGYRYSAWYISITAPVLSIRGARLSYRVSTSEPLLEHLVTKSSRASAVPFAFLETVSPPE